MMSVDVLRAWAVLQDCADQLAVLGNIICPGADTVSNIIKLKQPHSFLFKEPLFAL